MTDLRGKLRNAHLVQIIRGGYPFVTRNAARALVKEGVIAEFAAVGRRGPPFGHADTHALAAENQVERPLEAILVERRNRMVELRVEGVVAGEADGRARTMGPGERLIAGNHPRCGANEGGKGEENANECFHELSRGGPAGRA